MRPGNLLTVVLALALTATALAGREPLAVGDPAPGIDVEAWVTGDGVTIKPDKVYVVLFWDSVTRSGPTDEETVKSLGRVARLYELYGHQGLRIIVITPDNADQLADWVKQQRQGPEFNIGADRRSSTRRAWVGRADVKDLPVAFIVGKGKIMHMGRPRDEDFVSVLVQVMTGRFDPKLQAQAQPKLDAARRARKVKNWRMALKHYDEVIALDPAVFVVVALERFEMMLVDMDEKETAYAYAGDDLIGEMFRNDAGAQRMLAVMIVADPQLDESKRDLDVALTAALGSLDLEGPRDPDALSTAALVHFHRGEYDDATRLQTRAYFLARPQEKAGFKRVLDSYREAATRSHAASSSP